MAKKEGSPVPKEIKLFRGTGNQTRERRKAEITIPENPSGDEITIPAAPDDLSEEGKELWGRCAIQLKSVNIFFPSVYEYLHAYCRTYELRELAWNDLQNEGRYVMEGETETKAGVKRISQSVRLFRDMTDQMIALGAKLGLSPIDKTKISSLIIDKTKDKNSQKNISVTG